ncbi:hypothetical protein [Terracidiphilus sp.]|jgi:hypothetical protein|uniref:hypothetical protein n=1 Tax=Terracidiphilus sp. TaxID=1964191 RepID=UPI003C1CB02F
MLTAPYDGLPLGAPLSMLSLAGTLREANFEVVPIDAVMEPRLLNQTCKRLSPVTGQALPAETANVC